MIYFVQEENNGLIKIGYSANPKKRLKALQTQSAKKLSIIKTLEGDYREEYDLHRKFSNHLAYDEWFYPHKELIDYIENPDKIIIEEAYAEYYGELLYCIQNNIDSEDVDNEDDVMSLKMLKGSLRSLIKQIDKKLKNK